MMAFVDPSQSAPDKAHPKVGNNSPAAYEAALPATVEERRVFVTGLHNLFTKAAVLSVFLPKENPIILAGLC